MFEALWGLNGLVCISHGYFSPQEQQKSIIQDDQKCLQSNRKETFISTQCFLKLVWAHALQFVTENISYCIHFITVGSDFYFLTKTKTSNCILFQSHTHSVTPENNLSLVSTPELLQWSGWRWTVLLEGTVAVFLRQCVFSSKFTSLETTSCMGGYQSSVAMICLL